MNSYLIEVMGKLKGAEHRHDVNYCLIGDGCMLVDKSGGNNCFYDLKELDTEEQPKWLVVKAYYTEKVDYLGWLFSDSPLSEWFTLTLEEVEEYGCVVISCEAPSNVLMMCASAYRYVNEEQLLIDHWKGLVDAGATPSEAFVLAHTIGGSSDAPNLRGADTDCHGMFSSRYICVNNVAEFGSLTCRKDLPYSEHKVYFGITTSWSEDSPQLIDNLAKLCDLKSVKDPWGGSYEVFRDNPYKQLVNAYKELTK